MNAQRDLGAANDIAANYNAVTTTYLKICNTGVGANYTQEEVDAYSQAVPSGPKYVEGMLWEIMSESRAGPAYPARPPGLPGRFTVILPGGTSDPPPDIPGPAPPGSRPRPPGPTEAGCPSRPFFLEKSLSQKVRALERTLGSDHRMPFVFLLGEA